MKLVVGLSGVGWGVLMTAILPPVSYGDWGCYGPQSVPDVDVSDLWDTEAMQRSLNQRYIGLEQSTAMTFSLVTAEEISCAKCQRIFSPIGDQMIECQKVALSVWH